MTDAETRIGGRYRLVRQLAAGGMGTVWEGWDERLHRQVAIKQLQLQPGLSRHDAELASQRVMREARLTARLHHPHAVQVFDVVDDNNRPCLVMQYVPSRSLQEIVRDEGPLDPAAAARIGTQVAAALAAAHRAGIVHRDVKPGNILIAEDGTAKITDFGISHAVDDVTLTSTGLVSGTPAYLAPEVARGAKSDFSSDVYSLGATLYMAVEGQPPAGNETNPMAVLHRVASGNTNPPVRSGPITGSLLAMMASNPSERPTMVDIANDLTDVTLGRSVSREPTLALPVHDRPPNGPRLAPLPAELSPRAMAPGRSTAPSRSPRSEPPRSEPPRSEPPRSEPPRSEPPRSEPPRSEPPPSDPPPLLPMSDQPDEPAQERSGRSLLWPVLIAAVLVVGLGIVLGVTLLGGNSAPTHTAGGGPTGRTAPTSPSHRPHSQSKPAPSTTHRASQAPPPATPPAQTQPAPAGPPTADQLASAVTDYYNLVPADLDAGWQRLTRHFQTTKAQNRGVFDSYWNSVSHVDVEDVQAQPPYSAIATLVYHYKNGRVVTERTQFYFVRRGGVLKINETQVVR